MSGTAASAATIQDHAPPFDLRGLVREVCRTAGTVTDPAQLAKEVHHRIPEDAYGEALAAALHRIVIWELNDLQRNMRIARSTSPAGASGKHVQPARSAYVEGLRAEAAHMKYLNTLWKVDDNPTHRVRYGQCGRGELDYIIAYRRKVAAANTAEADRHQHVRQLLDQHHVDRVEQLPEEVLAITLVARER